MQILDQKMNLIEKNLYLSSFDSLFTNNSYKFIKGNFILEKKIGFGIKLNLKNFDKFNTEIVNLI